MNDMKGRVTIEADHVVEAFGGRAVVQTGQAVAFGLSRFTDLPTNKFRLFGT